MNSLRNISVLFVCLSRVPGYIGHSPLHLGMCTPISLLPLFSLFCLILEILFMYVWIILLTYLERNSERSGLWRWSFWIASKAELFILSDISFQVKIRNCSCILLSAKLCIYVWGTFIKHLSKWPSMLLIDSLQCMYLLEHIIGSSAFRSPDL